MTRRHTTGFDILGFDTDPTPGDPDTILGSIVPTYAAVGDDAQKAFDALKSDAMQTGQGDTMDALKQVIGDTYPPKLQRTADSFHAAAAAYKTYAAALADAQGQLDTAMDQAGPVAALAGSTAPAPPAGATADQITATQAQQSRIDDAQSTLTAAKKLAADAQQVRDRAADTFASTLRGVATVPERSGFQKFLDFIEHSPIVQILITVATALVSIFFPVLGFAIGAAAFGAFTAFNTLASGKFDVGDFVAGLLGLAFGGAGVAAKLFPSVADGLSGIGSALSGAAGKAGGFFTQLPGGIGAGIGAAAGAVKGLGQAVTGAASSVGESLGGAGAAVGSFAGETAKGFAEGAFTGSVGAGIDQARGDKPFDIASVLGGAAVGAAAGGAVKGIGGAVRGAGPGATQAPNVQVTPPPGEPVPPTTGPPIGLTPPIEPAAVNSPPVTGPGSGGLRPPAADTRPDSVADSAATSAGLSPEVVPSSSGSGLRPPAADVRPDSVGDAVATSAGSPPDPGPQADAAGPTVKGPTVTPKPSRGEQALSQAANVAGSLLGATGKAGIADAEQGDSDPQDLGAALGHELSNSFGDTGSAGVEDDFFGAIFKR